ncbi:exonuclease [Bacteriovorax sp. BSW11_IV]|uniref:3'-5' exonuclease n=1 Tax=Bacteriovorax sp. BSW11_IV TaxID=1353529 RepID=UPI00038A29BE|nr:3'-5' exonuclease [Bacteriovorax sp. BSW11_IV]EQC46708.1 exonuclease [Bacteriovorax sp. BSW11_IV]
MSEISHSETEILLRAFPKGVIAVDLETTGLSPLLDRIIELSAVKVTKDGIETFDQLINPGINIPQNTIDIHGITDEMVATSPKIEDVLPRFREFAGDLPFIAHNAKFDAGFIVYAAHHLNTAWQNNDVFCSCRFARLTLKDMPNYKLGTLSEELDITLENHHRALDDAWASLHIYIKGLGAQGEKMDAQIGKLFNLSEFSKNKDLSIPTKLAGIVKMVEEQRVLLIRYKGGSMRGQLRPIKAIALLPLPAGNILYAHCLKTNLFKSYSLNKIIEFREVEGKEAREFIKEAKTIRPKQ